MAAIIGIIMEMETKTIAHQDKPKKEIANNILNFYLVKIAITTILVVAISEIAKRNSFASALLASIPLISSLSIIWLYVDTKDIEKVTALSNSILWLVLPSLVLFITLPYFLKNGFHFHNSMIISIGLTIGAYWLMILIANHFGIKL